MRVSGIFQDEEHDLRRRIALAPATSSLKGGRRKVRYYWTVAVLLALAAFVFALLAFEPYQLGWKAYFYCCGIAVVTPFLLHESLERWNVAGIIRALATFATLAALFSLIVLAVIRGDILGREMETATPVVVDSTESAEPQQPQTDFYRDTLDYLRLRWHCSHSQLNLAQALPYIRHGIQREMMETTASNCSPNCAKLGNG